MNAFITSSLWDQMSIDQPSLLTIWNAACIIADIRGLSDFIVTVADSSTCLQVFPSLTVPYKPTDLLITLKLLEFLEKANQSKLLHTSKLKNKLFT